MPVSPPRDDGKAPYHHGDLRRGLLAAARALLEQGGREAVTLREAARTAGVSHNAPYRHFPSRDALLAALAAEGFAALRDGLRAAREASPSAPLAALGRAYLAFAARERPLFRLMFGAAPDPGAHPDLAAAAAAAFAVLRETVEETVPPDLVARETIRAWGLVHGLATLVAEGQVAREEADAVLA
ncbi:WHG domain-containing protein [Methylobacterium sp. JK268]